MNTLVDSRYPYTIAADFVRLHCQSLQNVGGLAVKMPTLSRSDVSQVMGAFETVFGLTHREMAEKIADYAIKHKTLEQAADNLAAGFASQVGRDDV